MSLRCASLFSGCSDKLIVDRGAAGGLLRAMDGIHRGGGRTWIGAVVDHGQIISVVASGKMAERLYSIYRSQT